MGNLVVDGNLVGGDAATDKAGFYGVTQIVQPAATAQSAVATTTLTALTSGETLLGVISMLNLALSRVEAIRVLQNQTRTDLIALGLQKGSI